jgi:SprT-like family
MNSRATKSGWTEQRLQRLFGRFNRRFWRGRLPNVAIRIHELDDAWGEIDWKHREIRINVAKQPDREVRATLLHEMAHLATPRKSGHDSPFWLQVERLLQQKAAIKVGFSETDDLRILADVVPRRFPLARRMMGNAEKRRARKVLKQARECGIKPEQFRTVGKREMVQRFRDAAMQNFTWREALFAVGNEYGLIDVDGKPKNRRCADLVAEGRRAHTRQRREFLSWPENSEAARAKFEAGA